MRGKASAEEKKEKHLQKKKKTKLGTRLKWVLVCFFFSFSCYQLFVSVSSYLGDEKDEMKDIP